MYRSAFSFIASVGVICAVSCDPSVEAQGAGASDQTFVTKASEAGMAEVEMGKLGAAQATNADIKRFAQQMVTDHQKANDELIALARRKGLTVAGGLTREHQETAAKVKKSQGESFDRDFMAQMVKDHEAAVELFSTEARSGQDADLTAWAAKTLPTLQDHLRMAKSLAATRR